MRTLIYINVLIFWHQRAAVEVEGIDHTSPLAGRRPALGLAVGDNSVAFSPPTDMEDSSAVAFSPPTDMETDVSMLMDDIANNSLLLLSDVSFSDPQQQQVKGKPAACYFSSDHLCW